MPFLGSSPSTNTRACKHSTLAAFYRYALARGVAMRSPLPAEPPKRHPSPPPHIYSRDELRRLLDATRTYRKRVNQLQPHVFRTLLLLLYGTGLRPGEALQLTLADIDLSTRLLTVHDGKFLPDQARAARPATGARPGGLRRALRDLRRAAARRAVPSEPRRHAARAWHAQRRFRAIALRRRRARRAGSAAPAAPPTICAIHLRCID